jgi:hypothetical protein
MPEDLLPCPLWFHVGLRVLWLPFSPTSRRYTRISKTRATCLPPHRPWDCAIDLLAGAIPTHRRIYPLSVAETQAIKDYIQEALQQGCILTSTSPVSAGFFFVDKKDGGLHTCLDYRGPNELTTKYQYPLPLVPTAIEQLFGARFFSKLDLRGAYNLIRIREGDEWKTAFSRMSGHYEYLEMPFGLANAPSVFQAFMNEVFRDMLGCQMVMYTSWSTRLPWRITSFTFTFEQSSWLTTCSSMLRSVNSIRRLYPS